MAFSFDMALTATSQSSGYGAVVYNAQVGGYQIGGNDDGWAALVTTSSGLPKDYSKYADCKITATFWSEVPPSSWSSDWGCYVELTDGSYRYGNVKWIDRSYFSGSGTSANRTFSINVSELYSTDEFEAGDRLVLAFYGAEGLFTSGSKCVYLKSGSFHSSNATKSITLKFNANGGSGAPSSRTVEADSAGYAYFTIPSTIPTRTNYTFLGWNTSSGATTARWGPGESVEFNANQTLYAVWRQNATYTVSFDANGGSGEPDSMSAVSNANGVSSFKIPDTIPTRPGYVFVGWGEDPGLHEDVYTAGDTFTTSENTTLYAIWNLGVSVNVFKGDILWTDCGYTLALYLNNIKQYTLTNDGTGVYTVQNVDAGTYDLYISGADTGIDITVPSEDDTNTIDVKYYTITYHANNSEGGTVPVDVNAYFDGASAPISDNVGGLVKTDHVFMGWNTSEDGNGTHYNVGDVISITSSLTLYAIWREATKAYIFNGTEWLPGDPVMFNGEEWKTAKMCMYTTEWNS